MSENHSENCQVTVFPEFEKLQKEINKMRAEISVAMQDRDNLKFHVCRNIEHDYMMKFGALEMKALEAETVARKLKRKLELIVARRNRQEKIIIEEIDAKLEEEFIEYEHKKEKMYQKLTESIAASKDKQLTEEEVKELKVLYRKIVKKLHPDLNPDVGQRELELFYQAVEAYALGNLDALRLIADSIDDELPGVKTDTLRNLNKLHKSLKAHLQAILDDIEEIKSDYPYVLREVLDSKKASEKRREELTRDIDYYTNSAQDYQKEIDNFLRRFCNVE